MKRDRWLLLWSVAVGSAVASVLLAGPPGLALVPDDEAASSSPSRGVQERLGLPEAPRNLEVLPAEMSTQAVVGVMRGFAGALGVRCIHCHVGDDPTDLSRVDFASDAKETKRIARVMMRMVEAINESHLPRVAELGREDVLEVGCATCHHGQSRPLTLEDVLSAELDAGGVEAMIARHDELRERYHGSWTYDFSPGSLASIAQRLARAGDGDAALALVARNTELHPASLTAQISRAQVNETLGNVEEARAGWRSCLEIDPDVEFCRRQLDRLDGEHRR